MDFITFWRQLSYLNLARFFLLDKNFGILGYGINT